MVKMNKEEFINELKKINVDISTEKMEQLNIYCNFLLEYNKHTNIYLMHGNPKRKSRRVAHSSRSMTKRGGFYCSNYFMAQLIVKLQSDNTILSR